MDELQQLFGNRFVGFDKDRELFRKFDNPFKASYEDTGPILQLYLINLHCSNEVRSKFKEGNLTVFLKTNV
jgi:hypothetical protein